MTKELKFQNPQKYVLLKRKKFKIVYKTISVQKQSSRGVIQRRCPTDMKQTYKRTPTQNRDLNKAAFQLS